MIWNYCCLFHIFGLFSHNVHFMLFALFKIKSVACCPFYHMLQHCRWFGWISVTLCIFICLLLFLLIRFLRCWVDGSLFVWLSFLSSCSFAIKFASNDWNARASIHVVSCVCVSFFFKSSRNLKIFINFNLFLKW